MKQGKNKGGRKSAFYYFVDGVRFNSLSEAAREHGVSNTTILNWCSDGAKGKTNCKRELKNAPATGAKNIEGQLLNQEPEFETAEDYLLAVVQGRTFPDSTRCQAARTLMSYQTPKKRLKAETPSPKRMRAKEEAQIEKDKIADFEARAKLIRAKYAKKE